jgi:multiple sugar transport system permease protein
VITSPTTKLVKAIAILLIVVWSVGPIVLGITTSLSTQREVNSIPTHWVPTHPTTAAYQALLNGSTGQSTGGTVTQGGDFVHAMTNSALIALGGAALTLIVATMAAYALGRLRFRLSGAVLALLVGTLIIPIFVIVIGLFQIMANAQLIDTKRGLVLVFVATQSPLATWLLYTLVRELPPEPEEAALIDGCRRWQAFLRVVVPQMSSGIAAVAAIIVLSIWGEFLIPLLLTSTMNAKPVTVLITEYVGKYTTNYPILAAAGVMALIPPAILALVLNKRITGMLAGSS